MQYSWFRFILSNTNFHLHEANYVELTVDLYEKINILPLMLCRIVIELKTIISHWYSSAAVQLLYFSRKCCSGVMSGSINVKNPMLPVLGSSMAQFCEKQNTIVLFLVFCSFWKILFFFVLCFFFICGTSYLVFWLVFWCSRWIRFLGGYFYTPYNN